MDLTRQDGNPASELTKIYDELMTITIPELFIARVKGRVEDLVGSGMSESNFRFMIATMQKCATQPKWGEPPIVALQKYITYYLLAAAGMATIKN